MTIIVMAKLRKNATAITLCGHILVTGSNRSVKSMIDARRKKSDQKTIIKSIYSLQHCQHRISRWLLTCDTQKLTILQYWQPESYRGIPGAVPNHGQLQSSHQSPQQRSISSNCQLMLLQPPRITLTDVKAINKSSLPADLVRNRRVYSLIAIATTARLVKTQPRTRKYVPLSSAYGPGMTLPKREPLQPAKRHASHLKENVGMSLRFQIGALPLVNKQ